MTIKSHFLILPFAFIFGACGVDNKAQEETSVLEEIVLTETAEEKTDAEADFSTTAPGEWQKSASGDYKLTSYGYNEEIGLNFYEPPYLPIEVGPMDVTIQGLAVIDYRPGEAQKRVVFGEKAQVRIVSTFMVIDNYSDEEITFNPDEATLITNTGETLKPLKYWTWTIDGNFIAGATKAVDVAWAVENMDSELTSVRLVIEPPIAKESNEILSEPLEIEIEILPF